VRALLVVLAAAAPLAACGGDEPEDALWQGEPPGAGKGRYAIRRGLVEP
jgi:hypothetical protein